MNNLEKTISLMPTVDTRTLSKFILFFISIREGKYFTTVEEVCRHLNIRRSTISNTDYAFKHKKRTQVPRSLMNTMIERSIITPSEATMFSESAIKWIKGEQDEKH